MNKRDLVNIVSEKTGLSKQDTYKTIQTTFECIANALQEGDRVTIMGFGSFFSHERPPRAIYDLYWKKQKQLEARKTIKFRPTFLKDSSRFGGKS